MTRQLDFAVVADDLTGACDCGAQLVLAKYRTVVTFDDVPNPLPRNLDAVVINTDTRLFPESKAYEKVYQVGRRVKKAKFVYKKIDSALRGHIGAELASAMEATERKISVIAPAFPNQGRTTKHGIQLLYGKPIDQTDLVADPYTLLDNSHIFSILNSLGLGPIANVSIEDLKNQQYMHNIFQQNRWIIADAETNEHLEELIHLIPDPSDVLWVGSAGLAESLGKCYPNSSNYSLGSLPTKSLRTLVVIGSLSKVSRQQVNFVATQNDVDIISLNISIITSSSAQHVINSAVRAASESLDSGKSVLIHFLQESSQYTDLLKNVDINHATLLSKLLAQIVVELSEKGLFDALILSGGETASTVTRLLGSRGINLLGELKSGVPFGTLLGDHQYFVITKSGNFGTEETLYQCITALNKPGGICHSL